MPYHRQTDPSERRVADAALVARALAGDDTAFGALTEHYFGMVFSLALASLAQPEAAEDLAQEVFLRAFLNLSKLDDPARFSAWLTRITRNLARDWVRQQQTRSRFLQLEALQEVAHTMDDPHAPSPRERVESDEQQRALQAALARLDPLQRELVLLHYMERKKKNEIAEILAVHPSTIGRQLDRALAALGADLRRALGEPVPATLATRTALARGGTLALLGTITALPASSRAALAEAAVLPPRLLAPVPAPLEGATLSVLSSTGRIAAVALLLLTGAFLALRAVYTKSPSREEGILAEIHVKLAAVQSYSASRVVRRTTATPWNFREVVRFVRPESYELRRIHYGGSLQETANRFCYIACDGSTLWENIQVRESATPSADSPPDNATFLEGSGWSLPAPVSYDLHRIRAATDRKPANEYQPRLLHPFAGLNASSIRLVAQTGTDWTFEASPQEPRPALSRIRLVIRQADAFLTRMECFDEAGESVLTETTVDAAIHATANDEPIRFDAPPGINVTEGTNAFLSIQDTKPRHGD